MKKVWIVLSTVFFIATIVLTVLLIDSVQQLNELKSESKVDSPKDEVEYIDDPSENNSRYLIKTKKDARDIAEIIFKANSAAFSTDVYDIVVIYKSKIENVPEAEKFDSYIIYASLGPEVLGGGGPAMELNRITGTISNFEVATE